MLIGKILRVIILVFISCLLIGLLSAVYFLFTTRGSSSLVKFIISRYTVSGNIKAGKIEGTLSRGLKLIDLEINGIKGLPKGTVFKVQQVNVSCRPLKFDTFNLEMENGRLLLPHSEPIILFAGYKKVKLSANIYSRKIDAKEILNLFVKETKNISGIITNVDSYIEGSFTQPQLSGVFEVENLSHKNFSLIDCPGSFSIKFNGKKSDAKPSGAVVFQKGTIKAQNITIRIKECKILFSPDLEKPTLEFKGTSDIGEASIGINFTGSLDKPNLKLSANTPHLSGALLLMLVTGKEEKELKASYQGEITSEQAKQLLDYFIFSSPPDKLISSLGLSEAALSPEAEQGKLKDKKPQLLTTEVNTEPKKIPAESGH
jgi:autotransporter translocation and assembly factor TamB